MADISCLLHADDRLDTVQLRLPTNAKMAFCKGLKVRVQNRKSSGVNEEHIPIISRRLAWE